MKVKYPFRCERPIMITLPNGDKQLVPCRHCKVCLLAQTKFNAFRCNLEALDNKYTFFTTFTYAPKYLPKVKLIYYNGEYNKDTGEFRPKQPVYFKMLTRRLNKLSDVDVYKSTEYFDYSWVFPFRIVAKHKEKSFYNRKQNEVWKSIFDFDIRPYYKKCKTGNCLGVLCKYDLQILLKTVRNNIHSFVKKYKQIYKIGDKIDERIRYYAVGEYGPETLRPHYHVLFFTNSDFVSSILERVLRKSWPYGRIDFQLSQGQASDYVASYVNSTVFIPDFLSIPQFRPFTVHSRYFGEKAIRPSFKEAYEETPELFVKKCRVLDGESVNFRTWRSVQNYYFPKCMGYSYYPADVKYQLYTVYYYAAKHFNEKSVAELTRKIYDMREEYFGENCTVSWFQDFFHRNRRMIDSDVDLPNTIADKEKRLLSFLYSLLYTSYRFVHFVCDDDPNFFRSRIRKIEDFYQYIEKLNYTEFLKSQQDFVKTFTNQYDLNDYLEYFYDISEIERYCSYQSYISKMHGNRLFRVFRNDVNKRFRDSVKHKEVNDKLSYWLIENSYSDFKL